MGTILLVFFTIVLILVSVLLILAILMQRANTNAGLGTAFGGGMAENTLGPEASNVLEKATRYLAITFFVLCLGLYLGYIQREAGQQRDGIGLPDVEVPAETARQSGSVESEVSVVAPEIDLSDDGDSGASGELTIPAEDSATEAPAGGGTEEDNAAATPEDPARP